MKKNIVFGCNGKIGSILSGRADFVPVDADITSITAIEAVRDLVGEFDVIVNCAAISSIDACEKDYKMAIAVNVHGLTNLHRVFGDRVLNISSDHIFNGRSWSLPKETTTPSPINSYGLTKFASEGVSQAFGGKTIRLSRTIDRTDPDIAEYLETLVERNEIEVPDFLSRNYLHREFAVDGIEYMVQNWDDMPSLVNYAGTENVTMYGLMRNISMEFGIHPSLVHKRSKYDDRLVPRPRKGGLNTSLANSLEFPMYNISDTVGKLVEKYG